MSTYFRIAHHDVVVPQETKLVRADEYVDLVHAQQIIKKARAREQEIVELAAQMYEQEKIRGYEEGMLKANEERATAIQLVNGRYAKYVKELEGALYAMVSSILNKIIGKIPAEELMLGMIQQALSKYTKKSVVKLTVNSELMGKIEETLKTMIHHHPFLDHIDIVGDLNVLPDKCILETKFEVIELDLQEQLKAVVHIMEQLQPNQAVEKQVIKEEVYHG